MCGREGPLAKGHSAWIGRLSVKYERISKLCDSVCKVFSGCLLVPDG